MTGPLPLPPFATVEQYEEMTGEAAPPNTQDLLDAASTGIRRYCGWHIAPNLSSVDLVVDGQGGRVLALPTLKLTDLHQVSERTSSTSVTITAGTDVEWSRDGYLRKSGCWTTRLQGITANVDHGFDLAEVADITQLVLTNVARNLTNPYGLAQQAVGGVSVSLGPVGAASAGGGVIAFDAGQLLTLDLYSLEHRP